MLKFIGEFWLPILGCLAVSTAGVTLLVIVVLPRIVIRLPARYFLEQDQPPQTWPAFVARNFFGGALVLIGPIIMTPLFWFPPGTGLGVMVVGVMLMEFPGRRRLLLRLLRFPRVAGLLNSIRVRNGLEEFAVEPNTVDSGS